MAGNRIVRAWKSTKYRNSLSEDERSALPENPAGVVELTEDVIGGAEQETGSVCFTIGLTLTFCSPTGTACGTCSFGTDGCCEPVAE